MYGVFGRVKGPSVCCLETEDTSLGCCSRHRPWKPSLHLPRTKSFRRCSKFRRAHCLPDKRVEDSRSLLAHKLALQYTILQEPAQHNILYSTAMKDFTSLAILLYECGYTEDTVRQEMASASVQDLNHDECLLYTCVVWITLMLAPSKTVVRWATKGVPVTDATLELWRGFVSLILSAYFEKRMAWYPVDRLQLEVSAVTGRLENPSTIAEFARLVYSTLHMVAPQFPDS